MKTYYEQLRELISEVPEIKKDLIKEEYFEDRNEKTIFPIEERHIRMYCEKNNIILSFRDDFIEIEYQQSGFGGENLEYLYMKLDNSKPFHQQDEEVYKQLVEYFKSVNN